ncbi:Fructosamine kinase-domain-containing protein [Stachybotrys elegans]|uniref:protein-ribulosamine 3-kinase n=1 Tax=Stachybotrys elegans TaxID=80388 RepID=A0A8K0WUF6_9HYPO|nr:Fructosamine kinase-domain-containing protein [Stachybotrys elegans]
MASRKPQPTDSIGENVQLDEAVLNEFPPGCKVLSVLPAGQSLWVTTVKILVQLNDGHTEEYFKKGAVGEAGSALIRGSFEAERAAHQFIPELVPRPIAWGTYVAKPDIHFYLAEFVDMYDEIINAKDWASAVSSLHLNSMGKSPTGEFGFHVNTHLANVPVNNAWQSSWQALWRQQMEGLFDHEESLYEPSQRLADLKTAYLDRAIPRYLGPLENDGRSVKPCLIHSDLWPGNIKVRASSEELCMFDACSYWGHNEADLAICRNPRYRLGPPFMREYFKKIPISQPAQDFAGRNHLYAIKYHTLLSILYTHDARFREILMVELQALVDGMESPCLDVSKDSHL